MYSCYCGCETDSPNTYGTGLNSSQHLLCSQILGVWNPGRAQQGQFVCGLSCKTPRLGLDSPGNQFAHMSSG